MFQHNYTTLIHTKHIQQSASSVAAAAPSSLISTAQLRTTHIPHACALVFIKNNYLFSAFFPNVQMRAPVCDGTAAATLIQRRPRSVTKIFSMFWQSAPRTPSRESASTLDSATGVCLFSFVLFHFIYDYCLLSLIFNVISSFIGSSAATVVFKRKCIEACKKACSATYSPKTSSKFKVNQVAVPLQKMRSF